MIQLTLLQPPSLTQLVRNFFCLYTDYLKLSLSPPSCKSNLNIEPLILSFHLSASAIQYKKQEWSKEIKMRRLKIIFAAYKLRELPVMLLAIYTRLFVNGWKQGMDILVSSYCSSYMTAIAMMWSLGSYFDC